MVLWKDKVEEPSATLFEGEEQLKICKICGPHPINMFTVEQTYGALCLVHEAEAKRRKDIKYDTSIRRKITTEARYERQPWEKYLRNAGQKFSFLPYFYKKSV